MLQLAKDDITWFWCFNCSAQSLGHKKCLHVADFHREWGQYGDSLLQFDVDSMDVEIVFQQQGLKFKKGASIRMVLYFLILQL